MTAAAKLYDIPIVVIEPSEVNLLQAFTVGENDRFPLYLLKRKHFSIVVHRDDPDQFGKPLQARRYESKPAIAKDTSVLHVIYEDEDGEEESKKGDSEKGDSDEKSDQ